MNVYCVKGPEGLGMASWLHRADALMVYLSAEDAEDDAQGPERATALKAETVTGWLEGGGVGRVRLVLRSGEHYLLGLDQWRELVAEAEERVRAEVEARTRRFLTEAVARGELAYDPQTGEYHRVR